MRFQKELLPDPSYYYSEHLEGMRNPKGDHVSALCPFHGERNPSFSVNLITGSYKCFGCGKRGGDVLSFHRERYQLGFVEAAKQLGAWA